MRMDIDDAVRQRYAEAAGAREDALCCPVEYDGRFLEVIPPEILQRDYGCGDPSRHLSAGETVLDLGSGGGKICYIASQIVGESGRVIGVDMTDEMLELAESHREAIGDRLGYHNVTFHKGRIEDLALDYRRVEDYLKRNPVSDVDELREFERWAAEQRRTAPMIGSETVDVVVSNCVLNLVDPARKRDLFAEMHRVVRPGGRVVISDIVGSEDVPATLCADPELWSGCIAGAYREDRFIEAFADAGFHGIEILKRDAAPWRVVEGIEFRAVTVRAHRGRPEAGADRGHGVIYRGPFRQVTDDLGRTLIRGRRAAVCENTYRLYSAEPYARFVEPAPPQGEDRAAESEPPAGCCGSPD